MILSKKNYMKIAESELNFYGMERMEKINIRDVKTEICLIVAEAIRDLNGLVLFSDEREPYMHYFEQSLLLAIRRIVMFEIIQSGDKNGNGFYKLLKNLSKMRENEEYSIKCCAHQALTEFHVTDKISWLLLIAKNLEITEESIMKKYEEQKKERKKDD